MRLFSRMLSTFPPTFPLFFSFLIPLSLYVASSPLKSRGDSRDVYRSDGRASSLGQLSIFLSSCSHLSLFFYFYVLTYCFSLFLCFYDLPFFRALRSVSLLPFSCFLPHLRLSRTKLRRPFISTAALPSSRVLFGSPLVGVRSSVKGLAGRLPRQREEVRERENKKKRRFPHFLRVPLRLHCGESTGPPSPLP